MNQAADFTLHVTVCGGILHRFLNRIYTISPACDDSACDGVGVSVIV